nr:LIC12048 family lipoprotein [Leptospira sarikeiensis]
MCFLRRFYIFFIMTFLISTCSNPFDWEKRANVDLSKATWLMARNVPLITDKGGSPGGTSPVVQVDELFNSPPGAKVKISSLGGAIDPTGTSITNDFDGDGILNSDETTTNVWVSDYPKVETIIAPPITMKVTVEKESGTVTEDLTNEINSDDFESGKSQGSEKIHQSEMNLKTVQFQDQYSSFSQNAGSYDTTTSVGYNGGIGPVQAGMNYSASVNSSWDNKNSLSTVTTKWADKPFKNNIDSDALNLKANSSSQKARKYRSDRSQKTETNFTTKPDGGYVRAALYIKNDSVNMPVKLSNILCSLMFETSNGDLIPVRSFELLKADGSNFEIEVYGGTEFGPYVVENIGLNAYEVERAIAFGYNPKIFIVDYKMTHVKDSNYKSTLLNFTGNNLKIIEENSKGRTSLIKAIGPNFREMYRVAAFEAEGANNENDICKVTNATSLSPGITLEKALRRLKCSGLEIEFENYVLDFSDIAPSLGESKLHLRGIKSFAGISSTVPCEMQTNVVGSDGQSRTACVQKPYEQWSENDKNNAGVWVVYSKGKYYSPTAYYMDGSGSSAEPRKFNGSETNPTFMVKGVESTIWAGDTYDIVFISLKDLIQKQKQFGTNPLETGSQYRVNTTWDLDSLGEDLYYPNKKSLFLGDAGFGEKVQLQIKLDSTKYLTPNFGIPDGAGLFQYFTNFTYNQQQILDQKFKWWEAMDFEVSLGFGGTKTEWLHVIRDVGNGTNDPGQEFKLQNCGRTLDFNTQNFFLCLVLPKKHPFVDASVSLIKLYIRPSLNNAYRRTIWPLRFSEVRKIRGELYAPALEGATTLLVDNSSIVSDGGTAFLANDQLRIFGSSAVYTINNVEDHSCDLAHPENPSVCKIITLTTPISTTIPKTSTVFVYAGLTAPAMRLTVENGFFDDWNLQYANIPYGQWITPQLVPLVPTNGNANCANASSYFYPSCLGFNADPIAMNWMGSYNLGVAHWNSWADANKLNTFMSNGGLNLQTNTGRIFQLDTPKSDFSFMKNSQTLIPSATSEPMTITNQDGQSLNIWKSGTSLVGRVYNMKTKTFGPYTTITLTAPSKSILKQTLDGNIFLIYDTSTSVSLTKFTIAPDNTFSFQSNTITTTRALAAGSTSYFDIAAAGTYSLVVWNHSTTTSGSTTYLLKGRLINSAGAPVNAADITIATNTGITATSNPQMMVVAEAITNSKVLVSYAVTIATATPTYAISSINCDDIATPGSTNSAPTFNTVRAVVASGTSGTVSALSVVGASTATNSVYRGMVVWQDGAGAISGRSVNLDTGSAGALIGASNTVLVDTTGGVNSNLKTAFSPIYNSALITYTKSNGVFARSVSIATSSVNGNAIALSPSTTSASLRKPVNASIIYADTATPKFAVTWENTDSILNKKSIRARVGTLQSGIATADGTSEIFVSAINDVDQTAPSIAGLRWTDVNSVAQNKILFTWLYNSPSFAEVKGYLLDLNYNPTIPYGSNNFFISPLIEREYLLKAQLVF